MSRQKRVADLSIKARKAIAAAVELGGAQDTEASLSELSLLLANLGIPTEARVVQHREAPDPASFLGAGKALENYHIMRRSLSTV